MNIICNAANLNPCMHHFLTNSPSHSTTTSYEPSTEILNICAVLQLQKHNIYNYFSTRISQYIARAEFEVENK